MVCVCVCLSVCVGVHIVVQMSEEDIGNPGAGIAVLQNSPMWVLGAELRASGRPICS